MSSPSESYCRITVSGEPELLTMLDDLPGAVVVPATRDDDGVVVAYVPETAIESLQQAGLRVRVRQDADALQRQWNTVQEQVIDG